MNGHRDCGRTAAASLTASDRFGFVEAGVTRGTGGGEPGQSGIGVSVGETLGLHREESDEQQAPRPRWGAGRNTHAG
ncbi:MAG TPA: hypothetical protein VN734_16035 [Acidobacteriaceae bacterium]|nr:hypothetical protein [Acidobacteriaceae bacterium]